MPLDYAHVPRLLAPTIDLTGTQAVRRAVSFPASGGVQFVDVNGAVVNPATLTGAALLAATQTFTGRNTFTPAVASGAVTPALLVTSGADTLLTIDAPIVTFDLTAPRTLAAGVDALQRAFAVTAPVYNGPGTITTAATFAIAGPPTGTAVTGDAYALHVQSGASFFNGEVSAFGNLNTGGNLDIGGQIDLATASGFAISLSSTPTQNRTVTFQDVAGTVALTNAQTTTNGKNARSGLTLWATPEAGEVGYQTPTAGTVARAIATAVGTGTFNGVYDGVAGQLVISGVVDTLLAAGLTLAANDRIYISRTTAGRATNVAPTTPGDVVTPIGVLMSAVGYIIGTGTALPVLLQPAPPVLLA